MPRHLIIKLTIIFILIAPIFFIYIEKGYPASDRAEIEPYLEKAYEAQKNGDLDAAVLLYQKALLIDPNNQEIYINLALIYEKKNDMEIAGFYWVKSYALGKDGDDWTEKSRQRLIELGLIKDGEQKSIIKDEMANKKMASIDNALSNLETDSTINRPQNFKKIDFDSDEIPYENTETTKKTTRNLGIQISLECLMISQGEQSFEVIGSAGKMISRLTYPIKGNIYALRGEVRLNPRFSIGGKYASSALDKTTNSDEDWNFVALHNGSYKTIDYQITKQDCTSKIDLFDINLYGRVLNLDDAIIDDDMPNPTKAAYRISVDIFCGYEQQKGRYTMKDPVTQYLRVVDNLWWQAVGLPLTWGLNSSYKVKYQGPRLGMRLGGTTKKLSTRISLSYAWIKTKADGWWNLRDYSFSQKSKNPGSSLNLELDTRYLLKYNYFIGIGYTYTKYTQKKAEESGVQPGYTYDNLDIIRDINNEIYGPSFIVGRIW